MHIVIQRAQWCGHWEQTQPAIQSSYSRRANQREDNSKMRLRSASLPSMCKACQVAGGSKLHAKCRVKSPCCPSRIHWTTADPGTLDRRHAALCHPLNLNKNSGPSFQRGLMCWRKSEFNSTHCANERTRQQKNARPLGPPRAHARTCVSGAGGWPSRAELSRD